MTVWKYLRHASSDSSLGAIAQIPIEWQQAASQEVEPAEMVIYKRDREALKPKLLNMLVAKGN